MANKSWRVSLAVLVVLAAAAAETPEALEQQALQSYKQALEHWQKQEYAEAERLTLEALAKFRLRYPEDKYPRSHADLVTCLESLARVAEKRQQPQLVY